MIEYGKDAKYKGRESKLQVSCFNLLRSQPGTPLVWHTANERRTSMQRGRALKAQGVTPGIPDLLVAEARGPYHGLAVEVKVQGGRLQDSQKYILDQFKRKGWAVAVVWSADGMKACIDDYWALEQSKGICNNIPDLEWD